MTKKILFLLVLICACKLYSQSTIGGTYMIGDKKASIGADEMSYYLIYDESKVSYVLMYEENTPENDQIWRVWKGETVGTIVFKSDYSSGMYTDYKTLVESYVKKIQ